MDIPNILSVSQLNFYIKNKFDEDEHLHFVFLEGEISNLTDHYASGHLYFSLKDNKSVIKAVMFKFAAKNLKFKPENGMKIICRGKVTVYEPSGAYQIIVEDMQPDGVGVLALQFEQLKKNLEKEGLFSDEHKKELPKFPKRIGVITSKTGAAVRDIINILTRRFPSVEIVMHPVLVQGESAAIDLTNAVNTFSKYKNVDVIIIGRGGGSMEDLWAFNDEGLARTIYSCEIPIISAVGHETDFTICDFVSDLRAPTPSAAAELAVPDREELFESLLSDKHYIDNLIDSKIQSYSTELKHQYKLIKTFSPRERLNNSFGELKTYKEKSDLFINNKLDKLTNEAENISIKLEAINPVSVLKRGFSYATKNGKNVSSVKDVNIGDTIDIKLSDGQIKTEIKEVND